MRRSVGGTYCLEREVEVELRRDHRTLAFLLALVNLTASPIGRRSSGEH